ncbi:13768_t:CDS:1 [Acaulospora colombiana]|uniref:13768_t:CDS:1 n=1 Tax=Acaulospora colombiana TaxID=27376 RepID=A0ACA9KSE5_9GLOM|nr:13768_t:CDS:1 [Acaulospora colombiana]
MPRNYNLQDYKPSFPPSITAYDIVKMHMEKGLDNANKTSNAFLIYRMVYSSEIAEQDVGNISKMASNSWRNESMKVRKFYREMANEVKTSFKKMVPICFVDNQDFPVVSSYNSPRTSMNMSHDSFMVNRQGNMDLTDDEMFIKSLPDHLALFYTEIMDSLPSEF